MRALLTALAAALTLLLSAAAADAGGAGTAHGPIRGVVPHTGVAGVAVSPHTAKRAAAVSAPGFLAFDANYESLINQYLTDVAHDSGGADNVYSASTQYSDSSGAIQYESTFGGSYVDHDPLPANGCDDGLDAVCLTDQQLEDEIQNVLTVKGWHGSTSSMFVILTPSGVGSCFDDTSTECTTNVFCAYHSYFTDSNGEPVIYSNEPYNATIDGCDPGSSPNGDDADASINTISHEHNEAITDPFLDAWYTDPHPPHDPGGNENGDLCAWGFGNPLGGSGTTRYNQVINGHHYWLQQEYSNADSGCVQSLGGAASPPTASGPLVYHGGQVMHTNTTYAIYWLPTLANTALPVVTGTAAVNHALTSSTGSWNGTPTGYSYQWQRCASAAAGCVDIPGATGSAYTLTVADSGTYVRSTVSASNVNGPSAYAASASQRVLAVPTPAGLPVLSGVAAVGKPLATTPGAWNTSASFAYRWLRCAADGSGCTTIVGATSTTYIAAAADAGHTLRAGVSATNLSGTTQALSNLSGVVVAAPRVTKAPRISGRIRVGRRLSAGRGIWSGPPTSYRYQWLRCNAHGGSCRRIHNATHARYRVTRRDEGHRLRVRVTAIDIAGSKSATSRATRRVPAVRRHH